MIRKCSHLMSAPPPPSHPKTEASD
uniref:Uncharacterized protein n=1 Tax=Anguilla anguilla TaxID=7936 RepID=A0A0E9PFI9_ANGAN